MRWGLVGYGWVARDHMAPGIRAAGGHVSAVADPNPDARDLAARAGIAAFDSAEAMLAASACDLVYVATPNRHHLAGVLAAAEARRPVLCEKPIAADLAEAEAIAAIVDASGILYGTAFDQRHHPAHRLLRARVAAGDLGTPVALRIAYGCWLPGDWCPRNWRVDEAEAGGGAVIDLALHGLDLAEFLLGEPLVDLTIMLQRRVHAYQVEDGGMLIARSSSGTLVSLHCGYNVPDALPRRRLELIGSDAAFEALDTMGQTAGGALLRRCARRGSCEAVPFDASVSPFTHQAAAFAEAARGGAHDFSVGRDLRLMRLFDAAYREARLCL